MFGFHSLCSALLGESPIRGQVLWVGLPVFVKEAPHWGSSLFPSPGTGLQLAQGLLPQPYPLGQLSGLRLRQIEVTPCQMATPVEPSDTGQGPAAMQPHGSPQSKPGTRLSLCGTMQTCDSRTLGVNFQLAGLPATDSLETP